MEEVVATTFSSRSHRTSPYDAHQRHPEPILVYRVREHEFEKASLAGALWVA